MKKRQIDSSKSLDLDLDTIRSNVLFGYSATCVNCDTFF